MRGFTVEYFKTLTETIGRIEERTSAEVVVVVEPWSGSYRDVDFALGAVVALLGLAGMIYSPWAHAEIATLIDVALLFVAGVWVSTAIPALRRLLTRPSRRAAQVREAAGASFFEENVWTTRGRTGILLYLSLFERELVVLVDRGITAAVEVPTWNAWLAATREVPRSTEPAQALLAVLEDLGKALAHALPPQDDNPDELPNLPRNRR